MSEFRVPELDDKCKWPSGHQALSVGDHSVAHAFVNVVLGCEVCFIMAQDDVPAHVDANP